MALVEVMVTADKLCNVSHVGELARKLGDAGHGGFVRRLRRLSTARKSEAHPGVGLVAAVETVRAANGRPP